MGPGTSFFHWTPVSITLLAEVVLAFVMLGFLLVGRRNPPARGDTVPEGDTGMFALVLALLGGYLLLGFLRSGVDPDLRAYVTPLLSVLSMVALSAFVWAVYRFPAPLETWPGERLLCATVTTLLVALEIAGALHRYRALANGHVEYRPAWMDFGFPVPMLRLGVLLVRQLRLSRGAVGTPGRARALLLAAVPTLGIVFFNVLPGGGGFSNRVVAITLVTMLAVLSTMAWLVSPVYLAAFRSGDLAMAGGRAFSFIPLADGAYRLIDGGPTTDQALGVPVALGGRITLPFDFPFYGKTYRSVLHREDGMLGFDETPVWRDVGHRFGAGPAIYPLDFTEDAPLDPSLGRCDWVIKETPFVDNFLLYRALRCNGRSAEVEVQFGNHTHQITLVSGLYGEKDQMIAQLFNAEGQNPLDVILRNTLHGVDNPAERAKCRVVPVPGKTDEYQVDDRTPAQAAVTPADGPRSACGPYGLNEDEASYWKVAQGMVWFVSPSQDLYQSVDIRSLTFIAPDGSGGWQQLQ